MYSLPKEGTLQPPYSRRIQISREILGVLLLNLTMSDLTAAYQPMSVAEKRLYGHVRHTIYEVDLERKTAFCTACGYTEIHVVKSRTRETPKAICITRIRELNEAARNKRSLGSNHKPRHILTEVDPEKRTANCSICGPTDILQKKDKGSVFFVCGNYYRAKAREYHRSRYTPKSSRSSAHTLSQIDEKKKTAVCSLCGPVKIYVWQGKRKIGRRCVNARIRSGSPLREIHREENLNLINRYKIEHGCNCCGYTANLLKLFLFWGNGKRKQPNLERLLRLRTDRLRLNLEKCYVLCVTCRDFSDN